VRVFAAVVLEHQATEREATETEADDHHPPGTNRNAEHDDAQGGCRSNAGDSERMRGIDVKLCRGGGQLVAHSSERPQPHGSLTVTTLGARGR
jgi:hypothetical protein